MRKSILKIIIPQIIRKNLRKLQAKIFGLENEFKNMNNPEVFDKIYKERLWGENSEGLAISGSGSNNKEIIDPYISIIRDFLSKKKPSVIVDIGCGDFNIGSKFTDLAKKYIACDVSKVILEKNKEKFLSLENVSFQFFDLSKDQLPHGDVCLIRQVLQHLKNDDINLFVKKLNLNKPYKYLIVTEHLPFKRDFKPNLDKKSGKRTRLLIDSGVVLDKEPFNLMFSKVTDLIEVDEYGGKIKTIVYEF